MKAEDATLLASIISAVGTERLGPCIDVALRRRLAFDMSCAYLFRFNHPALLVHDGYHQAVGARTLDAYVRGGYLLDPFYVACVNQHPAGLWRMSELAPDSFSTSGFSISRDIHPCVSTAHGALVEEVGFIIPVQPRVAIVYTLMRNLESGAFADWEMQVLANLTPLFTSVFELHARVRYAEACGTVRRDDVRLEDAFVEILQGQLTETQRYIAKLVLQGHSNASIAALLGISEGTVKVHKHNIYQRLGIANNAELFRLFIDYLARAARDG